MQTVFNGLPEKCTDLLLRAVSACVPAHSSMDRGNFSLPSPSASRITSKLKQGAPGKKQKQK